MPVCSYIVIPDPGRAAALAARLGELPGCDVAPAGNSDLLLLVTDTTSADADEALRSRIEALPELQALVLTFGEVTPDDLPGNPAGRGGKRRAGLPVLEAP